MSETQIDTRGLRHEVEQFIDGSGWAQDVPTVPSTPVRDWGTLGWARLVLVLLARMENGK